jgi:hypothetical protein
VQGFSAKRPFRREADHELRAEHSDIRGLCATSSESNTCYARVVTRAIIRFHSSNLDASNWTEDVLRFCHGKLTWKIQLSLSHILKDFKGLRIITQPLKLCT